MLARRAKCRWTAIASMRWCGILFFFQAEDGIRDIGVTGVQTCALPILVQTVLQSCSPDSLGCRALALAMPTPWAGISEGARSEERRVGKECRSRWSPYH